MVHLSKVMLARSRVFRGGGSAERRDCRELVCKGEGEEEGEGEGEEAGTGV